MRLPNHKNRAQVTFNMTPMIDVVFLLIIFFLVASHFAKQESIDLDLPTADSGFAPADQNQKRVTVNLKDDGTMFLGSFPVTDADIEPRIRRELQRRGKDLEVRIRSSRSVPYDQVEPIMVACAKAGVWNVKFAVYLPGDVGGKR